MRKTLVFILVLTVFGVVWTYAVPQPGMDAAQPGRSDDLWAAPPEDSLMGWSNDQLKSEVYRLRRELQDLKKKLGMTDTVEIKSKGSVKVPKGSWKVDDFESQTPTSGIGWWTSFSDQNNMGTTILPASYERQPGGSPLSPGYCAGIRGHLGPSEEPWTWAFLQASLSRDEKPVDLNGYRELWFAAKGDGKYYVVSLQREVVKDYNNFQTDFIAPETWTLVKIPLSRFSQSTYGTQYPRTFPDVKVLAFSPELHEADYDLKIDDVVFVK